VIIYNYNSLKWRKTSPSRARELEAGEETFFCERARVTLRPTAKGIKSGTASQAEPRKKRPSHLVKQVHKAARLDDSKRKLMRFERAQRLPFRIFLLTKPGGLWLVFPVEGGKRIVRSVQKFCGVGAAKKEVQ